MVVAWDHARTHQDDEVEAVVRAAAGCLVLLYVPTYRPWRNPIELVWRHVRREVTPCALFDTMGVLITAAYACFARYTHLPQRVLSIIGAHPTSCMWLYLVVTPVNINGYRSAITARFSGFTKLEVLVPRYGLVRRPWQDWEQGNNPSWWRSCNNVKHERHSHFVSANLENALDAMALVRARELFMR